MTSPSSQRGGIPTDPRSKILNAQLKKAQGRPDRLIEVLHKAQELYGYLDTSLLWHVARSLKLPPSRVYGVASFYHLFRLKPPGTHTCVICTGTSCFMSGADELTATAQRFIQNSVGCHSGSTNLLVETVRCVGVCWLAPIVVLDGEIVGPIKPEQLSDRIAQWSSNGSG